MVEENDNFKQKIDNNIVNENSTSTVNNQNALNDANYFEIIKQAFVYNMQQAIAALEMLISDNDLRYFTNRFKDREKLRNDNKGGTKLWIILIK